MENREDVIAETKMYFGQIVNLCNLILEAEKYEMTSVITLRDLALSGKETINTLVE